jgi:hypothetical protein
MFPVGFRELFFFDKKKTKRRALARHRLGARRKDVDLPLARG